jgi:hypothetical protein
MFIPLWLISLIIAILFVIWGINKPYNPPHSQKYGWAKPTGKTLERLKREWEAKMSNPKFIIGAFFCLGCLFI